MATRGWRVRRVQFVGEIAIVLNQMRTRICDCLMVCLLGGSEQEVRDRQKDTIDMMRLLAELCARSEEL